MQWNTKRVTHAVYRCPRDRFIAAPIIGKLSDRWGRKPLLLISLAGTIVANLLVGTASNAIVLFGARFLEAAGLCAFIVLCLAVKTRRQYKHVAI